MLTLYIVRGVSGSGKTTLAKEIAAREHCLYFEADMWFEKDEGYVFDARELPQAHEWCFNEVADELAHGRSVIVSNTFTRLWEMRNYIDLALDKGAKIRIITCRGRYQNTHGLSEAMVAKQLARFQSNLDIGNELKYNAVRFGSIVFSNHGG